MMERFIFILIGVAIGLAGLWFDKFYRVIHSLLFLIIIMPLSIFVVSSTGNSIGEGLVSCLMVGLFGQMVMLHRHPEKFLQRFGGSSKPLTGKEILFVTIVFGIVTSGVVVATIL